MTSAAGFPLSVASLGLDRREQVEIAGDEARGAGADAIGLGPFDRAGDQRLVEAKPEIVVAGEIDVGPPLGADDPRIARRDREQRPPQALAGAGVEKGPVPAFACRHDPVLAKGQTGSNRNASPVPEILKTANPINGNARQAKTPHEPQPFPEIRHDWTSLEVLGLLTAPLLELVDEAREVHRRYHADGQVQLASLLSIKTGACPEDCKYCAQSAHYAKTTGLKRETLLDVDDVLAKAGIAKEAGAHASAWARPGAR